MFRRRSAMLPLPPPQGGPPWGPDGAPCGPLTLPLRQELPLPPGKLYKRKQYLFIEILFLKVNKYI